MAEEHEREGDAVALQDGKTPDRLLTKVSSWIRAHAASRSVMEDDWGFYDGDLQWALGDREALERERRPVLTNGRVATTVNYLLGMGQNNPTKTIATPREESDIAAVELINHGLDYLEDENDEPDIWDEARFKSYVYGFGLVRHFRSQDPRKEIIAEEERDPRNFFWDPAAKKKSLDDAEGAFEIEWFSLDAACHRWPEQAGKLKMAVQSRSQDETKQFGGGVVTPSNARDASGSLYGGYRYDTMAWQGSASDWYDLGRKEVRVVSFYLREYENMTIVRLPDGDWFEFNPEDPAHVYWASEPGAEMEEVSLPRMNLYVFCGDILLYGGPSPYDHDTLPYVMVWAYRDRNGWPQSVVRNLKDAARQINKSYSALLETLSEPGYLIGKGAMIQGINAWAKKAAKRSAVLEVPGDISQVIPRGDRNTSDVHMRLIQMREAEIKETAAVGNDQLGQQSNAESGVAIDARQQQSNVTLLSLFRNVRAARKRSKLILISMMQQFWTAQKKISFSNPKGGRGYVILNEMGMDEAGRPMLLNDISRVQVNIRTQETADKTELQRQQEFLQAMAEKWAASDPMGLGVKTFLLWLDKSSFVDKEEMAATFREAVQEVQAQQGAMMPPPDGVAM